MKPSQAEGDIPPNGAAPGRQSTPHGLSHPEALQESSTLLSTRGVIPVRLCQELRQSRRVQCLDCSMDTATLPLAPSFPEHSPVGRHEGSLLEQPQPSQSHREPPCTPQTHTTPSGAASLD